MNNSTKSHYYLTIFFCLAIVFIGTLTKIYSNDFWWHLAEGKYNLTNGVVLDKEIFSYTVKGQDRFNAYWLCQIFFYIIYLLGGLNLAIVSKAFVAVLSFYMAIKVIRVGEKTRPALWALGIMLVLFLETRSRFILRPLIFMFFFMISYYYVLLLYREKNRNYLPLLIVLQLIWGGTHTSVFYGLMLVGFFVAEAWLRYITQRINPEAASRYLR